MANAHYLISNTLEAAYKNASHIDPGDLPNFIGYAIAACDSLERHHRMEETLMFPRHEAKIKMTENVEQHEKFLGGITDAMKYLQSADPANPNAVPFEPSVFRSILDGCLLELFKHLAEELDTITPEIMRAHFEEDYVRETQEMVDNYLKQSDPFIFPPLAVYSGPKGYGFPEMPWILRNLVVPGPCDTGDIGNTHGNSRNGKRTKL